MGEEKQLVKQYEQQQKQLKKEVKKLKKQVPYFIFGFIFFGIALVNLFDGKFNDFVGNSYNLIVVISTALLIVTIVYMVIITMKVKRKRKEVKALGSKIYKIMKLK